MSRQFKKEKIIDYLITATYPVNVEEIRKNCGIGNWDTALNYCFELMIDGKIKGQRTSNGWVFWAHQKTELNPYEEAIGTYEDLQIGRDEVTLTLSINKKLNLAFPTQSQEANILINTLKEVKKGAKIALLRTDIPTKPLIIKTLNETTTYITNPETIKENPEILQKEIQARKEPKIGQKSQAPTTNLDHRRWRLILGSFVAFLNFVKIRVVFGMEYIFVNFGACPDGCLAWVEY